MRSVVALGLSLGLSLGLLVDLAAPADAKTVRHPRARQHPIVLPGPDVAVPPAWYGHPRYPGYAPISPSPYQGPDPATQGTG